MSEAGSGIDVANVNLTLDDEAAGQLPDAAQIVSGSLPAGQLADAGRPVPGAGAGYGAGRSRYRASTAARRTAPWVLYVVDDAGIDVGSLASWSLNITTSPG
jgi:hypothetical protein